MRSQLLLATAGKISARACSHAVQGHLGTPRHSYKILILGAGLLETLRNLPVLVPCISEWTMKVLILLTACAALAAARPMDNQPGLHLPVSTMVTADFALVSQMCQTLGQLLCTSHQPPFDPLFALLLMFAVVSFGGIRGMDCPLQQGLRRRHR